MLAAAFGAGRVFCEYCSREVYRDVSLSHPRLATVDHRTPKARGGSERRSNLAIACYECNHRKGFLTQGEFMQVINDRKARKKLAHSIARAWTPDYVPRTPTEAEELRRERQARRLAGRLKEPDPDCQKCDGNGTWHDQKHRPNPCVCTVVDPRGRISQRGAA